LIVIIDNYDSFTYNLYQYIGHYYKDIIVLKNDDHKIDKLEFNKIKAFVFSPGPGQPNQSGKMPYLIKNYSAKIPMLGICLGHQAIVENYGGSIISASEICHGKVHVIEHYSNCTIFSGVKKYFNATRYHSLIASKKNFPDCLQITASSKFDKEIMAIKHKKQKIYGLQFHPESIETEYGLNMIKNFINEVI
tara:strand:- start:267 stop:842 length:576 start_codon:yes stop_codon:yes gene_type:complete